MGGSPILCSLYLRGAIELLLWPLNFQWRGPLCDWMGLNIATKKQILVPNLESNCYPACSQLFPIHIGYKYQRWHSLVATLKSNCQNWSVLLPKCCERNVSCYTDWGSSWFSLVSPVTVQYLKLLPSSVFPICSQWFSNLILYILSSWENSIK